MLCQRQNRAQKLPNVPSDTLVVVVVVVLVFDQFLYHYLYPAPVAAAALPPEAANAPCRTGKHSGPEGRNSAKIEPKNSLTSLLKP